MPQKTDFLFSPPWDHESGTRKRICSCPSGDGPLGSSSMPGSPGIGGQASPYVEKTMHVMVELDSWLAGDRLPAVCSFLFMPRCGVDVMSPKSGY